MWSGSVRDRLVNRFKGIPVDKQNQEIQYLSTILGGVTIEKLENESDSDHRVRSFYEMFAQLPEDSLYPDAFHDTYSGDPDDGRRIIKMRTFDLVKDSVGGDRSNQSK